jgi:hypothetical protein
MNTKEEILKMGFKDSYIPYINSINYDVAENLVSSLVSLIIKKYGQENIKFEIDYGDPSSTINNFFTHIIEVGALTVISESQINVKEINNFKEIIVLVSISLNYCLAARLKESDLFDKNLIHYYSIEVLQIIMGRINNSIQRALDYSLGFDAYADGMLKNNLIDKLS